MAQKKISHNVPHLVENCCQQPNAQKSACVKIKQNCEGSAQNKRVLKINLPDTETLFHKK